MVVLENFPDFTLQHSSADACLQANWRCKHRDSITRVHYELIRYHARETGSTRLLNNGQLDEDGWPRVVNWLTGQYFLLLAQTGVQVVAWVLPRNPAALFDTARVLAGLRSPVVDTFLEVPAATEWLRHWPYAASWPVGERPVTAAAFLLWPPARQLHFAQHYGVPLPARWEVDYYIRSYQVLAALRVDAMYQLHSGTFHQLRIEHTSAV